MKEQIIEVIREIKHDKSINEESHLIFDGILSSLEIVQFISELEEMSEIKIPIQEVLPDNFDTVDAIAKMIERLKN